MAGLKGVLCCMGNPLLDMSSVVDQSFLDKYGVKLNDAILAEAKQAPIYEDLKTNHSVEYIAGGATQNSVRVAQWMLQVEGATSYMGCVGADAFGDEMRTQATKDGVNVNYMVSADTPTGVCAVLVNDGERSLVTRLDAAEKYTVAHLSEPANWALVEKARFYYISGFFLTHSAESLMKVAMHATEFNKCFMMNLSAPFIMQVPPFLAAVMAAMPYIDFLFANESEAVTFAEVQGWATRDVAEIALKIAALPKASGARPRTVVFTQGSDATIVAQCGATSSYPVIKLEKKDLVDTNGAGDAFVGGFISQLVCGKSMAECCRGGNYAANTIIQRSGCSFPEFPAFTWA